ncbi:hypothetical protein CH92_20130 [Stutzerimonas stutzeri]|uniref:Uncharacterized protein n=1 Tax=Stutzerimonas stutzeri TaxID=316 RepID=W8RFG6_STUST|nr:hypothetical protein [Stutzerimonas stutzeri]AHL77262.1 hypothetical protein CH92_20130 [Stutzerimonas stutzeri]MCQ4330153.1 hypothetical protein [Stutzerimonas stutzeri]
MKLFFLLVWGLLSLSLNGAVVRELWLAPSWGSAFGLLLIAYYSVCFFQLIRAAYRPWGLLGPRRRSGYWVCLVLLPLALWPLRSAYDIWQAGAYRLDAAEPRLSLMVFRQLLIWLQELVGYLGPILVLVAAGVGVALLLLRLLRGQVVR